MKREREKNPQQKIRAFGSSCGQSQLLHGEPYPAAPHELLHVQQVDGQRRLELLAGSLWSAAVRAVHGHAHKRHQQEEASEQRQVGAGLGGLVGCNGRTHTQTQQETHTHTQNVKQRRKKKSQNLLFSVLLHNRVSGWTGNVI